MDTTRTPAEQAVLDLWTSHMDAMETRYEAEQKVLVGKLREAQQAVDDHREAYLQARNVMMNEAMDALDAARKIEAGQ